MPGTPKAETSARARQLPSGSARLFASTTPLHTVDASAVTVRAHEKMQAPSFKAAFEKVIGPTGVAKLQAHLSTKPALLIAGDQLTGKSTLAKGFAKALGGADGVSAGTGLIVRQLAAERGVRVEEMAKVLKAEPSTDIVIDYNAAMSIASGEVDTFESRLCGELGKFVQDLGRQNVISVYLRCAPRERALRCVGREVSAEARARLEALLNAPADADLETCLKALGAIDDPVAQKVAAHFHEIAGRDATDLTRLNSLYGVNYQDTSSFDLVLDTTLKTPAQLEAELAALVASKQAS